MSLFPIGIDLGTTNSLIAVLQDGKPRLIPNALGEYLTPSAVSVTDNGLVVGRAARDRQATHAKDTATAFKRSMGTDKVFTLGRDQFRAEDLSALVLRQLKQDAEADLGQPVTDVVVSVPAYFNQSQRQATVTACKLAGLNAVRLVNEPTAAALAYGLQDKDGESQFLVFDLGGGTFDVTLLEHFQGVMQVKASSGDAFLGGEDFTESLAKGMADKIGTPWANIGPDLQRDLLSRAEGAKRSLSRDDSYPVTFTHKGVDHSLTLDRAFFEDATKGLVKRLFRPIERCFYDSGEAMDSLDRVILVGGATRMPMIRQLVARHFRKLPEMTIDPDHAVALGAAVQAGLASQNLALGDMVMTDVSPFSVGIATGTMGPGGVLLDGFFQPIIERNTPLPASREQVFSTLGDNQISLKVNIYQGEAPKVVDNIFLGSFSLRVPKGKAGAESMAVRVTYDTSGLIEVEARSLSTGKTAQTVIRDNATGLSDSEIAARLRAMNGLKMHPREHEENTALLARIQRLYEMASGDDRRMVQDLLIRFEGALTTQDTAAIDTLRGDIGATLDRIDDYYVS